MVEENDDKDSDEGETSNTNWLSSIPKLFSTVTQPKKEIHITICNIKKIQKKNMKNCCNRHTWKNQYSKQKFRKNALWTTDLEKLADKFVIQNFFGVYPADEHPNQGQPIKPLNNAKSWRFND